ncbi:hypothetical protein CRG98_046470 [Punica granatum]|uniref:Uncharacterized protein n=1 Tax=Punica granatum TaxID=22663 RepID=A0A2I0HN98_PUNGR|nr:hypothetical protein CRG98_046470 [Punica granatum]
MGSGRRMRGRRKANPRPPARSASAPLLAVFRAFSISIGSRTRQLIVLTLPMTAVGGCRGAPPTTKPPIDVGGEVGP